jgi:hypothetical protein
MYGVLVRGRAAHISGISLSYDLRVPLHLRPGIAGISGNHGSILRYADDHADPDRCLGHDIPVAMPTSKY